MKPNLFVIGAMKSGTTTLAAHLAGHPDVFMTTPKEPHYFVKELNLEKGEQWYTSLFRDAGTQAVRGEASTTYSMRPHFDGVPERVADFSPDSRIIYILREPISRIVSHYWHFVRWHGERRDLLTAVRDRWNWVLYSCYAKQIAPYIEIFGRSNVKVVCFESMASDCQSVMSEVFEFLNVQPHLIEAHNRQNETPKKIIVSNGIANSIHNTTLWQALSPLIPHRLKSLLRKAGNQTITREMQNIDDLHEMVRSVLLEDYAQLQQILGQACPTWNSMSGFAFSSTRRA